MKSQAANNRSQQGPSTTSWELARTLKEQAVPGSTKTHWQHWDAGKQLSLSGNFHQTLAHTLIKSKIRLSKHGPCKFTNTPKTMSSLNSRIQLSILNKKKEPDLVQKGFTLVELMVVIVIVGILSAIALPNFLNNTTKAKATEAKTKISAILKDAHAEYQLDGQIETAIAAAKEQAEDNDSDNFTFTLNPGTADDQITVTAVANPSADGGDATLVTAEADGTALDGCVNLTTGKIEIRKSFKDDTALDCSA